MLNTNRKPYMGRPAAQSNWVLGKPLVWNFYPNAVSVTRYEVPLNLGHIKVILGTFHAVFGSRCVSWLRDVERRLYDFLLSWYKDTLIKLRYQRKSSQIPKLAYSYVDAQNPTGKANKCGRSITLKIMVEKSESAQNALKWPWHNIYLTYCTYPFHQAPKFRSFRSFFSRLSMIM